jgi:sulfite exporter TauE/SafE
MDYLAAFLLGLIGSLHCAGMCGPLALALPNPASTKAGFLVGRLAYNAGRLLTYCAIGLVFGLIGRSLALAGVQRWISIAVGAVLLVGLFASRKVRLSAPVSIAVQRLKTGMGSLLKSRSLSSLLLLGLLNGLLPCGLVYVAAAGATAAGGIPQGTTYMAAFGLGTIPAMLTISLGAKLIPFALRLKFQRAIPVSVFLLAVLLILRGMSLGVPYLSPDLGHGNCCH